MYNREIETNREAWVKHQESLKANASTRLKKNAEWNKRNKKSEKSE